MTNLTAWFHILLALIAYFAAAVLASMVVRKIGGDLQSMAGRSSPRILFIGAVANLGVLVIVLSLLTLVDRLPISALGLALTTTDLIGAQLLVSTAIFVFIHFLTNKVNRLQVISWSVSGLVLGGAYLISGSLWVPIVLHYATDLTNAMIFNITGQSSLLAISPALSEQQRAVYRGVYGVAMAAILMLLFSPLAQ